MTEYIIECYEKGAKKPYKIFKDSLPNRDRPKYTNSKQCFDNKLDSIPRFKIRYANNGKLVAVSSMDANGNKRVRWKE